MHKISILNDILNLIEYSGFVCVCLCALYSHNHILKYVCCISGISQLKLKMKGDPVQRAKPDIFPIVILHTIEAVSTLSSQC